MKSILLILAISALIINQSYKKKAAAVYFGELPKENTKSARPAYKENFAAREMEMFKKAGPVSGSDNYSLWLLALPQPASHKTVLNENSLISFAGYGTSR